MRAVGFYKMFDNGDQDVLADIEAPMPVALGHDLLVQVRAVAVNPVDVKTRRRVPAGERQPVILGFDAAGTVEAVGPEVKSFQPGDEVFYAGSNVRPGSYCQYQLVDERIVGPKPKSLTFAQAAALPLTTITAWEMLFDRLAIAEGTAGGSLLVIGGGGGVGSMAIQLARRRTRLTVIATASRAESRAWCYAMGAHHVVDHDETLAATVAALGVPNVDYVFSIAGTEFHWPAIAQIIAPQGRVGVIDDPEPLDIRLIKPKSVSIHWENMFTRSTFGTADMAAQHRLLTRVSQMVDAGEIGTTINETIGPICAATITSAHDRIASGHGLGKMVAEGFPS